MFGLVAAGLLIYGINRETSSLMIWWIAYQGTAIVLKVVTVFDLLTSCTLPIVTKDIFAAILVTLLLLEVCFMFFIVKLYQEIFENEFTSNGTTGKPSLALIIQREMNLTDEEDELGNSTPMITVLDEFETKPKVKFEC